MFGLLGMCVSWHMSYLCCGYLACELLCVGVTWHVRYLAHELLCVGVTTWHMWLGLFFAMQRLWL